MDQYTLGPLRITSLTWSETGWWEIANTTGQGMTFQDGTIRPPSTILATTGFRLDRPFRLEYVGHWIAARQDGQLFGYGECYDADPVRTFIARANAIMSHAHW